MYSQSVLRDTTLEERDRERKHNSYFSHIAYCLLGVTDKAKKHFQFRISTMPELWSKGSGRSIT